MYIVIYYLFGIIVYFTNLILQIFIFQFNYIERSRKSTIKKRVFFKFNKCISVSNRVK